MNKLLFLPLLLCSIFTYAQNQAPIAINDTLHFSFGATHFTDSLTIPLNDILQNDYDPDGSAVQIESIIYSGTNDFSTLKPSSTILSIYFKPKFEFSGLDTFQYVIVDVNGSPVKRDTATVALIIGPKSYENLQANNINATISSEALFSSPSHENHGFEAPINSNIHSIFSANLWVAGTLNGTVHSNA
ncbi:MAG: Ig-like domain-containing protein, partial [Salibacteraceae bacterium]